MRRWVVVVALVLLAATGCSKQNSAFCCATEADCAANGVTDGLRPCDVGLACIDNSCEVASCATDGCQAAAPVCDLTSDTCAACSGDADCARFAASPLCDDASGGCVQCVMSSDCSGTTPFCEDTSCRACRVDSECPSGACGEDGACVPQDRAAYISPTGADTPPCSASAPCASLRFAISQTTAARDHVVIAPGTYDFGIGVIVINASATSATSLVIHGGGSTLMGGSDDGLLDVNLPVLIRDLELNNPRQVGGWALVATSSVRLERVTLRGPVALDVRGQAMGHDVKIYGTQRGIDSSGALSLDRAVIQGGTTALRAMAGTIALTNTLIHGTTGVAVDAQGASGSFVSSTLFNASNGNGTDVVGLRCTNALVVRTSIIWTPTSTARSGITGPCTFQNSIVGPTPVAGATSLDPLFADPSAGDFHLTTASPARDQADTGPALDFEGDPRPQGARFDLGADEGM